MLNIFLLDVLPLSLERAISNLMTCQNMHPSTYTLVVCVPELRYGAIKTTVTILISTCI